MVNLCLEIQCQNTSDCKVEGETCIEGVCKCGSMSSCENRKTGDVCEPMNGECRCSETLSSCPDPSRGNICDSKNNSCRCSLSSPICNGNYYCTLGSCIGKCFLSHYRKITNYYYNKAEIKLLEQSYVFLISYHVTNLFPTTIEERIQGE